MASVMNKYTFVDFEQYCCRCEYYLQEEEHEECAECLKKPAREYSHIPERFKAKEGEPNRLRKISE